MSCKSIEEVSVIINMNNIIIPNIQKRNISFSNYSIRNQNMLGGDYSKYIKGNEDTCSQFFFFLIQIFFFFMVTLGNETR